MTSERPPLPARPRAVLTMRIGEPFGRSRAGWKDDVQFTVSEGYGVLRQKCLTRFVLLTRKTKDSRKYNLVLRDDQELYMKKAKNDPQDRYVKLGEDNFIATLQVRWGLLSLRDQTDAANFRFEVFLYIGNDVGASSGFHRATAARIDAAGMQRVAYQIANNVTFGPITSQHLDTTNARTADDTDFLVPDDNTTRQSIALDAMRDAIAPSQPDVPTAVINVNICGHWIPVTVDKLSMRRALGLPDHDIFTQGIFHNFVPPAPSNPTTRDTDHEEEAQFEEQFEESTIV